MSVTDPLADMLTRIRNAIHVNREDVLIPRSALKLRLLELMREEGFIRAVTPTDDDGIPMLKVELRYYGPKDSAIHGLKRVSKPGLRVYVGKDEIPAYYGGLGMAFMSTSKGIMPGSHARKAGLGGELLFYVW